jgi:photoactive yellow protein
VKYTLDISNYSEEELNALPFGIIHLDENGMVLDYNSYESQISRLSCEHVIGKNFFGQIAPCTSVPEFFGRFSAGLKSGTLNENFTFDFPFSHGYRRVSIAMLGDVQTRTAWIFVADSSLALTLRLDENRTVTLFQVSGPPGVLKINES